MDWSMTLVHRNLDRNKIVLALRCHETPGCFCANTLTWAKVFGMLLQTSLSYGTSIFIQQDTLAYTEPETHAEVCGLKCLDAAPNKTFPCIFCPIPKTSAGDINGLDTPANLGGGRLRCKGVQSHILCRESSKRTLTRVGGSPPRTQTKKADLPLSCL